MFPISSLGSLATGFNMRCALSRRAIKRPSRPRAQTFRQNKDLDVEAAITELAVGEALVSLLNEKGQPGIVDRALIYPPKTQLPPLAAGEREQVVKQSTLYGHYERVVDRESAYEMLKV